ncbi:MAG: hypothetical protein QHI48_11115 [Bacteroidota bacterium]|nr:hypothetical protein [Bacteroidota bacterium]
MWTRIAWVSAASILLFHAGEAYGQARLYGGVKGWYASWDLHIDRLEGVEQTDYSAAFLAGPYATLRLGRFMLSTSFVTTAKHFQAEARNPGIYHVGFNANRLLLRTDVNVQTAWNLSPEFSLFAAVKYLRYVLRDATVFINGTQVRTEDVFTGTGLGGGALVSVPLPDRSPWYVFLSVGAVYNSFNVVIVADKDKELLYFLESGMGFLVPGSNLAFTVGIRGEHGEGTKSIIGPMAAVFYRFF